MMRKQDLLKVATGKVSFLRKVQTIEVRKNVSIKVVYTIQMKMPSKNTKMKISFIS